MEFQLKDLLNAVGPPASLVFAAWIFLSYLQARYSAAAQRYRELTNDFRNNEDSRRHDSVRRQISIYRKRCRWMWMATNTGVVSAVLLLSTLVMGALDVVFPAHRAIANAAAAAAVLGLLLVIAAAVMVLVENAVFGAAMEDELTDMPEFKSGESDSAR